MLTHIKTGKSLLWANGATLWPDVAQEKQTYSKIFTYANKLPILNHSLEILKSNETPQRQIENFKNYFNKEENQKTLSKSSDPFEIRILKNIGLALLSVVGVGLFVSYKTKGTPFFWKSSGQALTERAEKLTNSEPSETSKQANKTQGK